MEVVRRAATTSHAHAAIGSSTVVGVAIVVMSFGGVTASTDPNITVVNVGKASQVYLYERERRERQRLVSLRGVTEEANVRARPSSVCIGSQRFTRTAVVALCW